MDHWEHRFERWTSPAIGPDEDEGLFLHTILEKLDSIGVLGWELVKYDHGFSANEWWHSSLWKRKLS